MRIFKNTPHTILLLAPICWKIYNYFEQIQLFFIIIIEYKICITGGFTDQCEKIKRDSPNMKCVQVQDSIECANLLRNGSSGFGIFSAESTLLLAALDYDGLTALKELRHSERLNCKYDSHCSISYE